MPPRLVPVLTTRRHLRRSCVMAPESVTYLQTRLPPRAGHPPRWYCSAPPPNYYHPRHDRLACPLPSLSPNSPATPPLRLSGGCQFPAPALSAPWPSCWPGHPRPASLPRRHLPGLHARCHRPQVSESKRASRTRAENDAGASSLPLSRHTGGPDALRAERPAHLSPVLSRWRQTGLVTSLVGTDWPLRRCWEHRLTPTPPQATCSSWVPPRAQSCP